MTLAAMLDDAAARSPHAVAILTSAGSLSFADLADRVARVAHGFVSLGLTGNDRVAFLLPNGAELAISILAAAKAGLIAVPLSPTFAPPQLEYILRHSGARMLVTSSALLGAVTAEARDQLDAVVLCGDVPDEPPAGAVPFGPAARRPRRDASDIPGTGVGSDRTIGLHIRNHVAAQGCGPHPG
jgi:acyl-CoA synthetase (AMP-forming)/AMP-acid ligase II